MAPCAVCLEPLKSGVFRPACGHAIHAACIGTWGQFTALARCVNCPTCRAPVELPPSPATFGARFALERETLEREEATRLRASRAARADEEARFAERQRRARAAHLLALDLEHARLAHQFAVRRRQVLQCAEKEARKLGMGGFVRENAVLLGEARRSVAALAVRVAELRAAHARARDEAKAAR